MWSVTRYAPVSLDRRVFVNKRSLLVCVTLDASCIGSGRQPRLFEFETAVRIVAVAASHGSLENLVMGRHGELVFDFIVTTQAKLRFADS